MFLFSTQNVPTRRGQTANSKVLVRTFWMRNEPTTLLVHLSTRACFCDHYLNKFMEFVVSPHSVHLCLFESCPWIKIHNLKHTNQCLRTFFSELSPNHDRLKYLNNLSECPKLTCQDESLEQLKTTDAEPISRLLKDQIFRRCRKQTDSNGLSQSKSRLESIFSFRSNSTR